MAENSIIKLGASASLIVSLLGSSRGFAENSPKRTTGGDSKTSMRIASFAPSCTDLVESVHGQDSLVGVCRYCELPAASKIERIGDFNSANLERLTRLKPDMVLAVAGQEALIGSLKKSGFAVTVFTNSSFNDISKNLVAIGKLTNREKTAQLQAQAFEHSIDELKSICVGAKPSVFFCVWPQPLLTAGKGSFLNEAVTVCGGTNIGGQLDAPYPHYSMERLVMANPDIIVMPYEAKSNQFLHRQPWTELKAAKHGRIYFLPKASSDHLTRPSTQVIDGLSWLGKCLHPEKEQELSAWLAKSRAGIAQAAN